MAHPSDTPRPILDSTRRFSERADYYVRSRPRYPVSVLEFFREKLGLNAGDSVADVGSGTGILSELFLQNGNPVFAVEPNDAMRTAAEERLRNNKNFHSIKGTAEATGLAAGSVKFVVAGQAFHWFDPVGAKIEFCRILIPDGWVALIWNERQKGKGGFSDAYQKAIDEFEVDKKGGRSSSATAKGFEALTQFFLPGGYTLAKFENYQDLDLAGLEDRALSSSNLPLPGHPRCARMLERLREIFAQFQSGGKVRFGYDTEVYYGQLCLKP